MNQQLLMCFELLVLFQVKHFIADFPLQMKFMVTKKTSPGWDFFIPLLSHCAIHGLLTAFICMYYYPRLWWLGIMDLGIHFAMDRFKANPKYLGRYNDVTKSSFWWALGFDQMVHHLTHIYIIWLLVRGI